VLPSESLPWRGPGPGRPDDLPLPPGALPVRRGGRLRKQWRYTAAFADELMVCAARVRVGPIGQTFWAICDRESGEMWEHTRLRLPGARGEVWTEAADREGALAHAPEVGAIVRIESDAGADPVRASLRFGAGPWVEAVCPTPEGLYVWTRKRVGGRVACEVRVGGRRWRLEARGVEDESEGYHPRHTVWSWSAGVGESTEGAPVGWNLVSGVNDPPQRSERAIWVDGDPFEPGPVTFEGLDAISFEEGSRIAFTPEFERRREERFPYVRYSYRQPFGSFSGTLPRGIELERGLGVVEHHDALW
jgi:hypothetical protein